MEWQYAVLKDDRTINAFCLPGGKVAVYTGLLRLVDSDDELAAVMGHEAAHALAHHSSERLYREQMQKRAVEAANGSLGRLGEGERRVLVGLLAAGALLKGKAYDRAQESEADHIGLFLMTFAGYRPEATLAFWEKMQRVSRGTAIRRRYCPIIRVTPSAWPSCRPGCRRPRRLTRPTRRAASSRTTRAEGRQNPSPGLLPEAERGSRRFTFSPSPLRGGGRGRGSEPRRLTETSNLFRTRETNT